MPRSCDQRSNTVLHVRSPLDCFETRIRPGMYDKSSVHVCKWLGHANMSENFIKKTKQVFHNLTSI